MRGSGRGADEKKQNEQPIKFGDPHVIFPAAKMLHISAEKMENIVNYVYDEIFEEKKLEKYIPDAVKKMHAEVNKRYVESRIRFEKLQNIAIEARKQPQDMWYLFFGITNVDDRAVKLYAAFEEAACLEKLEDSPSYKKLHALCKKKISGYKSPSTIL